MSDSNSAAIDKNESPSLHQIIIVKEHKITKIAVSPQSKYVLTYSQEDESFVGWCINNNYDSEPLILDNEVRPYKHRLLSLDFKVSDKKVIMYEDDKASGNCILIFTFNIQ